MKNPMEILMESKNKGIFPCPFCGCKLVWVEEVTDEKGVFCIDCRCGARGPWADTEEEAIAEWNSI